MHRQALCFCSLVITPCQPKPRSTSYGLSHFLLGAHNPGLWGRLRG